MTSEAEHERRVGVAPTLAASLRLWRASLTTLTLVALAVVVPVAGLVTILDLIAWQELELGEAGVELRELAGAPRAVDVTRLEALTAFQYALGAASYALVALIAFARLGAKRSRPEGPRPGALTSFAALLACLALVAVVRIALSLGGGAALAPLTPGDVTAYLIAINAVHGAGKLATAPILAAVLVVVGSGLGPGPGSAGRRR